MRRTLLAAPLAALAAMPAAGRERTAAHPSDEAEVFTGSEEVEPETAPRGPAFAYWKVRAPTRAARLPVAPTDRVRLARDLAAGAALSSTAPAGS
jgi:hypothetical protein